MTTTPRCGGSKRIGTEDPTGSFEYDCPGCEDCRPTPSPEALKEAEEACKEAYFDLTTHPSEAGPKGAALLNEYLKVVEPRVALAIDAAVERERKRCLEAVDVIRLHLEGSTCECGESMMETDAHDATIEALTAIDNALDPSGRGGKVEG